MAAVEDARGDALRAQGYWRRDWTIVEEDDGGFVIRGGGDSTTNIMGNEIHVLPAFSATSEDAKEEPRRIAEFLVKCLNARDDGSDVADDREE